ncbi:phosphatase PAP2 family protein [Paenibacillus beijingensis]|uniref:Phosphoesterase PA-phosphatase n=1 Tax=Paenibacillus beijingensis TaxID=1126833 RepID=A0A0D5NLQ4_9BACL|nr:phosphatase PAP2 family protein [Paenibacillus beijingensis]AJY76090.1 phosphoesterase PA-phosphatase [Paenibacillus beijingensis]
MVLFHSMTTVLIYTVVTVALLIAYGTGRNPFRAAGLFIRNLFVSRRYLFHFVALIAILFCNKYELLIEKKMQYHADFTHAIQSMEGNFVMLFQQLFHTPWLTPVLAFFYIVVFQSLLIASIGVYTYMDKSKKLYYATCYAVMLNYLIAIPFYLFFPVKEVWAFNPSVHFYMLESFPDFENQYRGLSGLDNCFPSLHTSISVTMAIIAIRSGIRKWAWFVSASAAIIIFTIFYMGIHWLTDMMGGVLLAVFASAMGFKLSDMRLTSVRRVRIPYAAGEELK